MQLRRWLLACSGMALVAYAACAFPEFEFDDESNSSTEAAQGGGATATTASVGGAAPCTLGALGSCGAAQKCTVIDIDSGAIGCGMAGSKLIWDKCNSDADCTDGTWCDLRWEVCKPFCVGVDDCAFDDKQGECVTAVKGDGMAIPGSARHCTSGCEPITAAPCLAQNGVTCIHTGEDGGFDCAKSGMIVKHQDCEADPECAPTLACRTEPVFGRICRPWCTPPGAEGGCMDSPYECLFTNPAVEWNGTPYGVCR